MQGIDLSTHFRFVETPDLIVVARFGASESTLFFDRAARRLRNKVEKMKGNPHGEQAAAYHVVLNHKAQYSIWPMNREIPAGWKATGKTGTQTDCLAFIEATWTDMRPLSLRKHEKSA